MEGALALRITVMRPPRGVTFRLQRGRDGLLAPAAEGAGEITFDFDVRVGGTQAGGSPNFLGEYTQGPKTVRFVYVNSGRHAGQADTFWDRRAKVPLMSITSAQIKSVLGKRGHLLEACIEGTGGDGGPACGTVPLLGAGWKLVKK